jgi:hypothetical protein
VTTPAVRGIDLQEDRVAIREGKWKCAYCANINLGRDVACAQCGQPRGKDVTFFLEEGAAEVTDQNLAELAQSGADWTCEFCSTNNRGKDTRCRQCGAERGSSRSLQEKMVNQEGAAPSSAAPPVAARSRRRPIVVAGVVVAVLAVFVLVYFLFFSATEKSAVLDRGQWQRSIAVEENKWVQHSDWENAVPRGAVVLDSHREKYGTEKVQTGTERRKTGQRDKGNGFFEDVYENVPVYAERDVYKNKVTYKIQEWVVTRTLKNDGELGTTPEWPAVVLSTVEREGKRTESAVLSLSLQGKTYRYSVPVSELGTYQSGAKYHIWVTPLGAVTKIKAD